MLNNNYIPTDFKERWQLIDQVLLDILNSPYWRDIIFKWGTMMTIFLESNRFSEDLDFNPVIQSKWWEIAQWIYDYLKDKWYTLGELYTDWSNVYNIEVFYTINWTQYNCQVEIFKDAYNTKDKYSISTFLWKPIKLLSIEQSFAHKCCAYIERWSKRIKNSWRPKWRDLYDIAHYINMNADIDLNIINERLWIDNTFDLFTLIYKKTVIDNYKDLDKLWMEIENFAYTRINGEDFIDSFIRLINKTYLNNSINYNIHYKNDIDNMDLLSGEDNITIDKTYTLRFFDKKYQLLDMKNLKYIYHAESKEKMKDYIKEYILNKYFNGV